MSLKKEFACVASVNLLVILVFILRERDYIFSAISLVHVFITVCTFFDHSVFA
jgi:hypothetical protein